MTSTEFAYLVGAIAAFGVFALVVAWIDVSTYDVRAKYQPPK